MLCLISMNRYQIKRNVFSKQGKFDISTSVYRHDFFLKIG